MNSHKLRHTGMIGIRLETKKITDERPTRIYIMDPMVRKYCKRTGFPFPLDLDDERRIKGLTDYAFFHVRESFKNLGRQIRKAIESDRRRVHIFILRNIRKIFTFVVILGVTTITLYFLRHFIF